MPIYEFSCNDCCHEFERLVFPNEDERINCPACEGENIGKLMSAGCFRPKGIATGSGGFDAPACKPGG